jgi:hypothetical protein
MRYLLCFLLLAGCSPTPTEKDTWKVRAGRTSLKRYYDSEYHVMCYTLNTHSRPRPISCIKITPVEKPVNLEVSVEDTMEMKDILEVK